MRIRYVLLALLVASIGLQGQQQMPSTLVQQSPTLLNACTPINATAAVNTTVTLTIPAPSAGQYIYICGIDITISFNTGGPTASTNVSFTSTNIGPAGATWAWKTSWVGTASTTIAQPFTFQYPVRANAPGTAVTIVSPAINATAAYSITAYYYMAI
jgi:hypothetical protein